MSAEKQREQKTRFRESAKNIPTIISVHLCPSVFICVHLWLKSPLISVDLRSALPKITFLA